MQREAVVGYPNGENDMPRQGTICMRGWSPAI